MDRTLQARLWRVVPPPGMRLRLLAIILIVMVLLVFGRGMVRYAVIPVVALVVWIGLDVLFGASLGHTYRLVARQRQALYQPDPFPKGPRLEWSEGLGPTPHAWHVLGPVASGFTGRIARTRMLTSEMRDLPVSIEITAGRAPTAPGAELPVPSAAARTLRARVPAGDHAGRAAEFLDAYTSERIAELASRAGPAGLRVRVTQGRVLVDVGRLLRRTASLNLLIDTALAVRDRARALAEGGAVKLGNEAAPRVATPDGGDTARRTCAVCFEAMEAAGARRCNVCGAAHHRDCFEWTGRCGTFSCSGTDLVSG